MQNHAEKSLADDYAAALDWWRDAGVDSDFEDEPQNWLAEAEPERPKVTKPSNAENETRDSPLAPAIAVADIPGDLEAFQSWWTSPETPLPAASGARVAPRGTVNAKLMILSTMPEAQDTDMLFGGRDGALLSNILKSLSIDVSAAYFASALPSHMPLPDWDSFSALGLGEVLHRHIALASPRRVLVMGNKLPMLLGHDASALPEEFTDCGGIPALATFAPERLLDHPRQSTRLWKRLLYWTS
ncbi:uracil-DNA glycosylase family protein [Aurantiacibacter sediminis]|uniref:Uracil-DNA glycosylase-like domain-containing protein n=1 Tax=Aurantiacibacter sediminis TaxID=2793064 RepID=A0ABS0N482_9SPHN|nr:uracil-DNA glycosylase family protein [Aurantiacibacter sediminis]MBH5322783.1 hypothetical protein [Aurantiacibacter sediminis]